MGDLHRLVASLDDPTGPLPCRVAAPGRVNLMGDHTDYHDGLVLPMAIDRWCAVGWRPGGARVRVRSGQLAGLVDLAADGGEGLGPPDPPWGRFVAGAITALAERGREVVGIDAIVTSTVPVGSGLSSSSALAVALTLALADAAGLDLDRRETARLALDAEIRATGVPGGPMDQLVSLLGVRDHALLIDCRDLSARPVAIPPHLGVLVVHSGVPRTLVGSAYADRRAECDAAAARLGLRTLREATPEQVADDPYARHVVSENQRVLDMAVALGADDRDALGALMLASHASLRDDFHVSTPDLDALVDALVDAGAIGARLTGAGFGGCVVALVADHELDTVAATALADYRARTGREPVPMRVRAVDGAGPVRIEELT